MSFVVTPCSQPGQLCSFFDLVGVEYNGTQCDLNGNTYEITFSVLGRRLPLHSSLHKYKAEVIEQGKRSHMVAKFARKAKPTFHPGYSQESDYLSSGGFAKITFLVEKAKLMFSGQRGIVVDCNFSHGTDLNEDNWCHQHQVSIIIKVV